jgi:polyphosphate kinase
MPRNLDHRVELAFPIVEPSLRQVVLESLHVQLADNVKARQFGADGRTTRVAASAKHPVRAQERAYELLALPVDAPAHVEVAAQAAAGHAAQPEPKAKHPHPRSGTQATSSS